MRPPRKLRDLFCCEGGAGAGYARAGFQVVGMDLNPRFAKRYPFEFEQGDAIQWLERLAAGKEPDPDVVHASPPCQRYTHGNVRGDQASKHPDLIGPVRDLLIAWGGVYVIENVPRSPLVDPLTLCWSMFDAPETPWVRDDDGTALRMERHRLFESNVRLVEPRPCWHARDVRVAGSYGGARRDKDEARLIRKGGYVPSKAVQERLLGIDWMTQHGLHQSVPPRYTQYVGQQLMDALRAAA